MIRYIILLIFLVVWLYILHVTKKAKLPFWHFLWGSAGLFVIIFVGFKDVLTQPMANIVAAVAGIVGKMTGVFEPYYKYGIIFVESAKDSITLKIDFECSGIIEITAFLSLLIFFNVYSRYYRMHRNGIYYCRKCIKNNTDMSYNTFQRCRLLLYFTCIDRKNFLLYLVYHIIFLCIYKSSDNKSEGRRIWICR